MTQKGSWSLGLIRNDQLNDGAGLMGQMAYSCSCLVSLCGLMVGSHCSCPSDACPQILVRSLFVTFHSFMKDVIHEHKQPSDPYLRVGCSVPLLSPEVCEFTFHLGDMLKSPGDTPMQYWGSTALTGMLSFGWCVALSSSWPWHSFKKQQASWLVEYLPLDPK